MNIVATRRRRLTLAALGLCLFAVVLFNLIPRTEAEGGPPPEPALNPITVLKTSVLVPVGDGNADPGETIEHTIVIGNGGTPATNVQLTDVLQSITTLSGSVSVSPIAVNDTYNAIGNVSISVPDGGLDLLANDTNPGGAGTLTITSAPATSVNGGNVSVNTTTGSFTYNPAPGFSGTDTFTYTLGNGSGLTDTASVTINVSTPIWFVQAGAPGGGDGRLSTPFNCLVGAGCFSGTIADEAGDTIFLYSGAYTGGQALLNNQRVLGQNAGIALAAFMSVTPESYSATLPSTGGAFARPTITTVAAATNGLNVGSGNTLRGFNIGDTTGIDISGTSFGTLTISEMALSGTGRPLSLTTGTAAITLDSVTATAAPGGAGILLSAVGGTLTVSGTTSITGAGAQGISIAGSAVVANFGTSTTINTSVTQGILVGTSTGNVSFGNTSVSGGTDLISLQNNSAGTRSFGTITTSNGTGDGFVHAVGGGTTTVSGLATITNPGGNCIDIQDSITAVTFSNVNCTQSAAAGVFLDDNSGAVTFADLDIAPDLGIRAFHATEPHTGAITTTSGTISTTNQTAIEIVGTSAASRTPLNVQLTTVSALASGGNPPNGIIVSNASATGSPGGFRILGTGGVCTEASPATCSGGHIQNTTGADVNPVTTLPTGTGVVLRNADTVSITNIRINGNQNYGIHGLNVNNFTLAASVVHGVNGTNVASPSRDSSIRFDQVTGTVSIANSLLTGGFQHNLLIDNQSGTANITVSGNTIKNTNAATGDDGFQLEAELTATVDAFVTNNSFSAHGGDHFNLSMINSAVVDLVFTGNAFAGGHAVGLGQGLFILGANYNGTFRYDISNNGTALAPLTGNKQGGMIHVNKGSGTGTFSGRIQNNFIGNAAIVKSGSEQAFGIYASARGAGGSHTTLIANNTVRQYFDTGIVAEAGEGAAAFDATVTNNTVDNFADAVNSLHGIYSSNGILAGDTNSICIDMQDNSVANAGNEPAGGADIRLRKSSAAGLNVRIPGFVGTTATDADAKITAENPTATTVTVTGANFTGGAACTQPILPSFARNQPSNVKSDLSFGRYETAGNLWTDLRPFVERKIKVTEAGGTAGEDTLTPRVFSGVGDRHMGDLTEYFAARPGVSGPRTLDKGRFEPVETRPELVATSGEATQSGAEALTTGAVLNSEFNSQPWIDAPRSDGGLLARASTLLETLGGMIAPTVYSQKKSLGVGDVNLGPFGIPANESVTIKFSVTVNNGPYEAGVNNITNTANVTADGGVNVNSNTTSIPLDAFPDLSITNSDGATVTEPGRPIVYTLNYANGNAINGQSATGVVLTETVPVNTTFTTTGSTPGWSCPNGSVGGTVCTLSVGALAFNTGGSATFAVNVLGALPVGAVSVANTASIADDGTNGADTISGNNSAVDTNTIRGNWDGSASADWNTLANWSNDLLPIAGNNISIPNVVAPPAFAPAITTGTVTIGMLTLNKNLSIGNAAVLSATGNVTLNTSVVDGLGTLSLGTASAITHGAGGQVNATLQKNFAAGPLPAFEMPVGTTGEYSPLFVTVTSGSGQLTARATALLQPVLTPNASDTLERYWTLSGSGITSNITFQYLNADVPLTANEAAWNIIRVTGTTAIRYPPTLPYVAMDPANNRFTISDLTSYSDWTAGAPLAPTAANAIVSGRVVDTSGRGVYGARVSVTDQAGNVLYAVTNPFGYYRFIGVQTGQTYTILPTHKRYRFQGRALSVVEDVVDLDFTAEP